MISIPIRRAVQSPPHIERPNSKAALHEASLKGLVLLNRIPPRTLLGSLGFRFVAPMRSGTTYLNQNLPPESSQFSMPRLTLSGRFLL